MPGSNSSPRADAVLGRPESPAAPGSAPPADEPLGLTVHSLPTPGQALGAQAVRRTVRGRWQMLLVLLVCAAPVVASYFTYYVIRPDSRRSYGELIDPQRPLPDVVGTALDGTPHNLQSLQGQWLFVSVAGGACDDACQKHLYLQRQLREGMGKEKERMDWVWLISDDVPVPEALRPALKGADVLRVPAAALQAWLSPAPGQALRDHLYVVDPMGHWMMRFPASLEVHSAAKAKRDLERLLRASASWDQPGR